MLAPGSLSPALLAALAAAVLASACNKTPEPEGGSPARPSGSAVSRATAAGAPASAPGEVAWDAPTAWVKAENPSPMRKATYRVPHAAADTEDAELSVSQAGGTVELNVNRWAGQLGARPEDVKRVKKSVGGLEVTVVEIHGTYSGMAMPGAPGGAGAPKPGWALLGAIVGTATPTFFKLTGPDKTVAAARADFDKLVESLRSK